MISNKFKYATNTSMSLPFQSYASNFRLDQSLRFKTAKCTIIVTVFSRRFVLSSKCGIAPNFHY